MSLLTEWRELAYSQEADQKQLEALWETYFEKETAFYQSLLKAKRKVTGTVPSLAKKYKVEEMIMVGILDGINDSLKTPNPIETMDNETPLSLDYDPEELYMNMVLAKADWLYGLPEWDAIFTKEKQDELYRTAKKKNTIVKDKKIGRNDPCPCGSGKKYKKCCGKNA